jgi:hypothetical protein
VGDAVTDLYLFCVYRRLIVVQDLGDEEIKRAGAYEGSSRSKLEYAWSEHIDGRVRHDL